MGIAERYVIVPPATGAVTEVIEVPWCDAALAVKFTKFAHCPVAVTVSPTATLARAV